MWPSEPQGAGVKEHNLAPRVYFPSLQTLVWVRAHVWEWAAVKSPIVMFHEPKSAPKKEKSSLVQEPPWKTAPVWVSLVQHTLFIQLQLLLPKFHNYSMDLNTHTHKSQKEESTGLCF